MEFWVGILSDYKIARLNDLLSRQAGWVIGWNFIKLKPGNK